MSAALISVDRLRAILGDTDRRENALWKEVAAWRNAFVKRNGLAYDPERGAIVHMDTGREYLPAREYMTPNAALIGGPEAQP